LDAVLEVVSVRDGVTVLVSVLDTVAEGLRERVKDGVTLFEGVKDGVTLFEGVNEPVTLGVLDCVLDGVLDTDGVPDTVGVTVSSRRRACRRRASSMTLLRPSRLPPSGDGERVPVREGELPPADA
jgi:hypothetical protein